MKNVIKQLAKSFLIPLGLTASASAAEAGIHKKILGTSSPSSSALHNNTILIIWNDKMKNIVEIVGSLEDSGLLPVGASETIQNEAKERRGGVNSMLLGKLAELY